MSSGHAETFTPPRQGGSTVARVVAMVGAIGGAALSIIGGLSYSRPEPEPEAPAPGMSVTCSDKTLGDKCVKDLLSLAADAPQWSVVQTAQVQVAQARWSDLIPGRVAFDESRTSRLGSPIAGHITAVFAERGQTVTAGAPLYSVSSASLADLRSDLQKAQVERETARKNLERVQSAVDAQVLAAKELVTAKQTLAESEVALAAAQDKLIAINAATAGGASLTVTAPRNGVVVEKTVAVGQTVSPDAGSLLAIADLSSVWVVADLFPSDIGGITAGAPVKIVIGNSDSDRDGTVDQVSAVVDPDRHTIPVRIKLDNPEGLLRPNAHVQVRVFDASATKVALPAAAVMSDGEHSFVYREDPKGTLRRRNVTVGSVVTGMVPVKSGLEPTDRVVVQGVILVDNELALEN